MAKGSGQGTLTKEIVVWMLVLAGNNDPGRGSSREEEAKKAAPLGPMSYPFGRKSANAGFPRDLTANLVYTTLPCTPL